MRTCFSALLIFMAALCIGRPVCAQFCRVKRIPPGTLSIDGKGTATAWDRAVRLRQFSFPWETAQAPATSFPALWDGQWLFCLFIVQNDPVINFVSKNEKKETGASDRVENIF